MRRHYTLGLGVLGLAVLLLTMIAPSASASVVGTLTVGVCPGGGEVTVGLSSIVWAPAVSSNSACLEVAGGTNITGLFGSLVSPTTPPTIIEGTINNLPGGDTGFMKFGFLSFNLAPGTGFGPGMSTSCATNPVPGASCSIPLSGGGYSPFILTSTASNGGTAVGDVNGTTVTLLVHGTITDSDGSVSIWSGSFTTPGSLSQTPSQIQEWELAAPGNTISSAFSGGFNVNAVPEPFSMALLGGGLLALAAIKRRKRV